MCSNPLLYLPVLWSQGVAAHLEAPVFRLDGGLRHTQGYVNRWLCLGTVSSRIGPFPFLAFYWFLKKKRLASALHQEKTSFASFLPIFQIQLLQAEVLELSWEW